MWGSSQGRQLLASLMRARQIDECGAGDNGRSSSALRVDALVLVLHCTAQETKRGVVH